MPFFVERSMTLSPKDVIKKYNVELLEQLPLDEEIFFGKAKKADLFPGGNAGSIKAQLTRPSKVSYFLQHVVEPGADVYLPKLLEVMKQSDNDSVKDLADEMEADMKPGNYACSYSTYIIISVTHNYLVLSANVQMFILCMCFLFST